MATDCNNNSYIDKNGYVYNYIEMTYVSDEYLDATHNKKVIVFMNKERLLGTE